MWNGEKDTGSQDIYLHSENQGWDYWKLLLGFFLFNPIDWITEQTIFHLQFSRFGWPRKSHGFALRHMLLGKPVISATLHCPVSTEPPGFGGIRSFSAVSKGREMIRCDTAEVPTMTIHACVGGWKGEGPPPSVSQWLFQAVSKLTGKAGGEKKQEKERSPFLEGKREFKSVWENLAMVIPYSKHIQVPGKLIL